MGDTTGDRHLPLGRVVTGGPATAPPRTPMDGTSVSLVSVDARADA